MTETTIVHLLRHGEVYNPTGVLYGRLPGFHLSDNGRAMADMVAKSVANRDIVTLELADGARPGDRRAGGRSAEAGRLHRHSADRGHATTSSSMRCAVQPGGAQPCVNCPPGRVPFGALACIASACADVRALTCTRFRRTSALASWCREHAFVGLAQGLVAPALKP